MTAIDVTRSRAELAVKHLMVTTVRGSIPILRGEVTDTLVEAFLDVSRFSSGDRDRDAYMKGPEGLDSVRFPEIHFVSRSSGPTPRDENTSRVAGDLTIKGVTRSIVLEVKGTTATVTLQRRDFGITFGALEPAVGREVKVTLHVFLVC